MRRAVAVVVLGVMTSGCAPMLAAHVGATRARKPFGAHAAQALPPPVVGRWDNVVALRPRTPVGVITADGSPRTGAFVRAGLRMLTIEADGIEVGLAREDVLRVDVLASSHGTSEAHVARGALRGALAVGGALMAVPYLITGDVWVPPARLWAAGAVLGAVGSVKDQQFRDAVRTVYVSSDLVR